MVNEVTLPTIDLSIHLYIVSNNIFFDFNIDNHTIFDIDVAFIVAREPVAAAHSSGFDTSGPIGHVPFQANGLYNLCWKTNRQQATVANTGFPKLRIIAQ